jgi:hypothetical protein
MKEILLTKIHQNVKETNIVKPTDIYPFRDSSTKGERRSAESGE